MLKNQKTNDIHIENLVEFIEQILVIKNNNKLQHIFYRGHSCEH